MTVQLCRLGLKNFWLKRWAIIDTLKEKKWYSYNEVYTHEMEKKKEKYYILNEQRKWILGCQYW